MLKNYHWQETNRLAMYNHNRGVKVGSTKKIFQLSYQSRMTKPQASRFHIQHPDHLVTQLLTPPIMYAQLWQSY